MNSALLSTRSPTINHAVLARLAERWRNAGLFIARFDRDGVPMWQDPLMPRAMALCAASPAIGAAIGNHNELSALTPYQPESGVCGIRLQLMPVVKRRRINGWLLVLGRTAGVKATEEICRLAQRLALDATAMVNQVNKVPTVALEQMPSLALIVRQMYEDIEHSQTGQHELSSVTEQLTLVYEEISLLYKISSGMRFSQKPQAFLETVCREVQEIGSFGAVAVIAVQTDEAGAHLPGNVTVMVGNCPLLESELTTALAGPIEEALKAGESMVHNGPLGNIPRLAPEASGAIERFVCVPLIRDKRPMGVILAMDKLDRREFDSVDLKLLNNVGNQCSIFLENAALYQDMQDLFMGVLHALTRSIDAKDAYTRGHSQRVAELSRTLAQKIGLSDAQCERVYLSGLLHDVGKIGVPEAVLTKPGRLTDAEFEAIKRHPAIGAQILGNIKQLQDIIPGVLYHHERWDGNGYPSRLGGENIPLLGRIICVADSFDAMSSTRTYRPALPLETVLEEINRCAGKQFDATLAKVFVGLDFSSYRRQLNEQNDALNLLNQAAFAGSREAP